MKSPLGRLTPVEPRDYWKDEAREFTPWLAEGENIALLGETLGMELEVQATEEFVGAFRADILCMEMGTDRVVLIENQLAKTDHNHLGQIMTYAAGLDAVVIVWVARKFTDEHRAALDWLNRITNESANFFGLEVELWRIGDSVPAPKFNVVCQPNDWSKSIDPRPQEFTELQRLQLDYWSAYRQFLKEQGISAPKPLKQNWMTHPIGRSGFCLCSVISTWNSVSNTWDSSEIRMEFIVNHIDAKRYFAQFEAQRSDIDSEVGEGAIWHNPENSRQCKVGCRTSADIYDRNDWERQFQWLHEQLRRFQKVFGPRVKSLTVPTQ